LAERKKATEVVLDFSGVKPFEPMDPDLVYLAQVSALTLGTSKSAGKPKVSCELTIKGPDEVEVVELDGSRPGRNTKASGRKLFREYSLEEKALPFVHEFIKAADPEVDLGDNFRFNPQNYMGLEVAVKIQNEEFQEQIRPRVKRVLPASAYKE
jgi:hypothetical protein